jgi:L-alanine-DL-glutamate epimerase-like enolase superfamily enzyme
MHVLNLNRRGFVKRISGTLASAFHIPVTPHGSSHMAINLLVPPGHSLSMETCSGVESRYHPALPFYPFLDGYITVPETPGPGIVPDPEPVKQYQTEN